MQLRRRGVTDAEEDGDTTAGARGVGIADSGALARGVWVVVRRHSAQSLAADLHVRGTFPVQPLPRS